VAPGEWCVLALLAGKPGYGWALAGDVRNGEVGTLASRPFVRALEAPRLMA
jgi:hypothetical protein